MNEPTPASAVYYAPTEGGSVTTKRPASERAARWRFPAVGTEILFEGEIS